MHPPGGAAYNSLRIAPHPTMAPTSREILGAASESWPRDISVPVPGVSPTSVPQHSPEAAGRPNKSETMKKIVQ